MRSKLEIANETLAVLHEFDDWRTSGKAWALGDLPDDLGLFVWQHMVGYRGSEFRGTHNPLFAVNVVRRLRTEGYAPPKWAVDVMLSALETETVGNERIKTEYAEWILKGQMHFDLESLRREFSKLGDKTIAELMRKKHGLESVSKFTDAHRKSKYREKYDQWIGARPDYWSLDRRMAFLKGFPIDQVAEPHRSKLPV